jgi:hypothetical protein
MEVNKNFHIKINGGQKPNGYLINILVPLEKKFLPELPSV